MTHRIALCDGNIDVENENASPQSGGGLNWIEGVAQNTAWKQYKTVTGNNT